MVGFLNLLLEPEVAISDVRYLNTELLGDNPELKRCVVDVIATDAQGNRYLVEMQNAPDRTIRFFFVTFSAAMYAADYQSFTSTPPLLRRGEEFA